MVEKRQNVEDVHGMISPAKPYRPFKEKEEKGCGEWRNG